MSGDYTAHLNPKELKDYEGNLQEITNAMTQQDAQSDLITEICKQAKEKFGIEPKDTRKVAAMRHKRNKEEEEMKSQRVFNLYETVYGTND